MLKFRIRPAKCLSSLSILAVILSFTSLCNGCASYSYSFSAVESAIASNKPAEAIKILDKIHSNNENILYNLNKAILLRMQGKFIESNEAFEECKKLIETYEAVSITEQTGTFIVNDTTSTYIGENYEQVLLHFYASLNYLELGKPYAARIEALQVDVKLRKLGNDTPAGKYKEDAFVRYFTGILYEELGEWSNAMIAYRKAYETYLEQQASFFVSVPESLKYALLRLAEREGLNDELIQYRDQFALNEWSSVDERLNKGEFVYILNSGLAPLKREKAIQTFAPNSNQWVRVSTPYYQVRSDNVRKIRISATNQENGLSRNTIGELVENIDAIALESLASKLPAITTRAIARAVVKYNVNKTAQQQNDALGVLLNIANSLSERADTRSWLTLPKVIYLARIALEPGNYNIQVELLNAQDKIVETYEYRNIAISSQKNHYISQHRIPNVSLNRGQT